VATKLQARTHTTNTRAAQQAQNTYPSQNPCQNRKGAATAPGSAAQTQRTARPRGVGVTAEAARSKGCSMGRTPFQRLGQMSGAGPKGPPRPYYSRIAGGRQCGGGAGDGENFQLTRAHRLIIWY